MSALLIAQNIANHVVEHYILAKVLVLYTDSYSVLQNMCMNDLPDMHEAQGPRA